jgi:PAS domain-containing protein
MLRCGEAWENAMGRFEEFGAAAQRVGRSVGEGFLGQVWAKRQTLSISDITRHRGFQRAVSAGKVGLRGAAAFPLRRRGEVIGVMAFFSLRRRPKNRALTSILATVSNQLEIFIERIERHENLRQTSQTLQSVVDPAPVAILSVDRYGRVSSWNAAAEQMFGWSAKEVVGKKIPLVPEHKEPDFRSFTPDALHRHGRHR